jgi:hypothetical protein
MMLSLPRITGQTGQNGSPNGRHAGHEASLTDHVGAQRTQLKKRGVFDTVQAIERAGVMTGLLCLRVPCVYSRGRWGGHNPQGAGKMAFSKEQEIKIFSEVNKYWRGDKCEVCLTDDPGWNLIDGFIGTPLIPFTGTVPLVGFVCTVCGHIRFLSAIQLGVFPSESGKPQTALSKAEIPEREGAMDA